MAESRHRHAGELPPDTVDGAGIIVDRPDLRVSTVLAIRQFTVTHHPASREAAEAFLGALGDALGAALPCSPNTRSDGDPYAVWLAPARWLLVANDGAGLAPDAWLATPGAAEAAANVVDSSDGLLVVDIETEREHPLMAAGCALDLDERRFPPGRSARTLFAGIHTLLYRHDGGYRLHVDAGLATYLCEWLRQTSWLLSR